MKKNVVKVLSIILSVFLLTSMFAACSTKNPTPNNDGGTGTNKTMKIAFISSAAGQNDSGYNKSAVDALKKVAPEIGAEYKIVEPVNGVAAAIETLAEDGYNLIFSLEYDFEALINGVGGAKALAEQYPDTRFVIFNANPNVNADGSVKHKNVISVLFDVHEASYLAGYAYIHVNENMDKLFGANYKMSPLAKSRAAGFIGGTNSDGILVYSYGFIEGMQKAAAEYGVKYDYYAKYDAGFVDPAVGSTVAGTFFDNGANIVFADCGQVGDGITSKAKEVGKLAIQVDANLDATQPGNILTSVLKITGVPVTTISKAFADGSIDKMENLQSYNLASGATGITDMSVLASKVEDKTLFAEIKAKVDAVAKDIGSGKIVVTNAQKGQTLDPKNVTNVNIK